MTNALFYSWIAFALVVSAHRHLRGERVAARAPGTWLGIAIQAVSFSLLWMMRRPTLLGIDLPMVAPSEWVTWLEGAIGASSILFAMLAIWHLGRNWSVAAQLVDGHRLVTSGPYRFVRHPIYTAMFGMLVATGLSIGNPVGLILGFCTYVIGTYVRVHFEERLLRAHFGDVFDQYASAVPAFIPFISRRSGD